jgi:hypothetical protein
VLKEHELSERKLDQRVEIGSTEAMKSLVVVEIAHISDFVCGEATKRRLSPVSCRGTGSAALLGC